MKRDSSKFIIDFFYTMFSKKYDTSKKYEDKVNYICQKIKINKSDDNSEISDSLCKFLNRILDEKREGDKIAHPLIMYTIKTENKNLDSFLIYFLEVQNYFQLFKKINQAKIENDISLEQKIGDVNKIMKDINFGTVLNNFLFAIKK